jgi:hypothetical protein
MNSGQKRLLVARVTIHDDDTRTAFEKLAAYYGVMSRPKNNKNMRIEMTRPVYFSSFHEKDTMMFVLPSTTYTTIEEAPVPNDKDIEILYFFLLEETMYEEHKFSSFQWNFHGGWRGVKTYAEQLMDKMDSKVDLETPWLCAAYNMPSLFIFADTRIMIPLKEGTKCLQCGLPMPAFV